jgi:CubicO group peptidase (beta-lactamase class C family)
MIMLPAKIIQTLVWVPDRVVLALKYWSVCLKFSFIASVLLLFQDVSAQKVVNTIELPDVDAFLKSNQKALGPAAVVVYKDDKVVFTKTNSDYFNAKTQAPIPGASKWFTAALVLTFVDEGKLKLDDPVSKYLPVMSKYMKNYITIRMCLAHTTGVENAKPNFLAPPKKKFDMLEEEINAYAAKEISNNAGEEFWYGDIGANIAGRVLEVISKKSFDRLAQERLFRPLKMRATTFTDFEGKAISPSGGAQTTALDMCNFLSMILNKGMFENKRILSEASLAEMQKAQFTDKPVKFTPETTEGLHHGLGAWLQEEDANGNGLILSGLGTFGSYPYVDNCRKYAAVLLLQNPVKEMRKDLSKQFKNAVEGQMGDCKPTN